MPYAIEIQHEWNKHVKEYLAHSDAIGHYLTETMEIALFADTLLNAAEILKSMDENYYISIEGGRFLVTAIEEVEFVKKRRIDIKDL